MDRRLLTYSESPSLEAEKIRPLFNSAPVAECPPFIYVQKSSHFGLVS